MHRFRRASAAGAPKEGNAHAAETSPRSSATAAATPPTAPYSNGNNEASDDPAVTGLGKRAAPAPPSTNGFFSNRHHSSAPPPPRISDGDNNISPFASLKSIPGSNSADSAPDYRQPPPAPSSSLWRGDAPSGPAAGAGAAARARGGAPPPSAAAAAAAAADAEQTTPPLSSPPCFRFPSSSGKRQQQAPALPTVTSFGKERQQQAPPLPTVTSFAKEHDRPNTNTDNSNGTNNNNSSDHGHSSHGGGGGPSPPDAILRTPHPKSAATHPPRGAAASPRAGGNVRGGGQQGRTSGSSSGGEGSALSRCAPRDDIDLGRRNDSGGDSTGNAKAPRLRDERQAPPAMATATGGRTGGARCSTPPPPILSNLSNDKEGAGAGAAVAALPPSQLDTVMEDHDPFDDLSAAESAIFADASARIQKLRRRQLSVREGFARSHSRLLQGDTGFKIHADAEQLVASTFSLLQEMNLLIEADAPRDG